MQKTSNPAISHAPKKIAILVAMRAEAQPIIEALQLESHPEFGDQDLPFEYFQGVLRDGTPGHPPIQILLSVNGVDSRYGVDNIGSEPATLNAYLTLRNYKPLLCINAGTAGGFLNQGAKVGDVYLSSDAFRFHDRRIPIPGFDQYGVGHYPAFSIPGMSEALGLKTGVVTTGNSIDCSDLDWKMMKQTQGSAKEMEAAGIAWVAHLLGIPPLAIKAITDLVDAPEATQDQFLRNLKTATQILQVKTSDLLEFLRKNPEAW